MRIQTVMPGTTATEFRAVAGYAPQKEAAITMPAAHLVDAALAGLDADDAARADALKHAQGIEQPRS